MGAATEREERWARLRAEADAEIDAFAELPVAELTAQLKATGAGLRQALADLHLDAATEGDILQRVTRLTRIQAGCVRKMTLTLEAACDRIELLGSRIQELEGKPNG
jgi:hypothetical protein